MGVNLHYSGYGKASSDTTPQAQVAKEKIDKLYFIKM